jgi:hypothetical protein
MDLLSRWSYIGIIKKNEKNGKKGKNGKNGRKNRDSAHLWISMARF